MQIYRLNYTNTYTNVANINTVTARTECYSIDQKGALQTAQFEDTKLRRKEGEKGKESALGSFSCPWRFQSQSSTVATACM